jgi:hypothetical protein
LVWKTPFYQKLSLIYYPSFLASAEPANSQVLLHFFTFLILQDRPVLRESYRPETIIGSRSVLQYPYATIVDDENNLLIADAYNKKIQIYTSDLQFIRAVDYALDGVAFHPTQLTFDFEGNNLLFRSSRLQPILISPFSPVLSSFGRFSLFADSLLGNLVVVDSANDCVLVFEYPNFKFKHSFGSQIFLRPVGITTDINGNLIIADTGNPFPLLKIRENWYSPVGDLPLSTRLHQPPCPIHQIYRLSR